MAAIVSDTTQTMPDGSTVQTVTYADGSQSTQFVPGAGTPGANRQSTEAKAINALASNVTFLALAAPTTAQQLAQLKLLTRECSAVIRLLLSQLADTTGT